MRVILRAVVRLLLRNFKQENTLFWLLDSWTQEPEQKHYVGLQFIGTRKTLLCILSHSYIPFSRGLVFFSILRVNMSKGKNYLNCVEEIYCARTKCFHVRGSTTQSYNIDQSSESSDWHDNRVKPIRQSTDCISLKNSSLCSVGIYTFVFVYLSFRMFDVHWKNSGNFIPGIFHNSPIIHRYCRKEYFSTPKHFWVNISAIQNSREMNISIK